MSGAQYSVVLASDLARELESHLLQHITQGIQQEDLCFALWRPSTGASRTTAVLTDVIAPLDGERLLHKGASFLPEFLERVFDAALLHKTGIAFLHSHFTPGWQPMSDEDVTTEQRLAPAVWGVTGLPLVGITMGTDGALSGRFWLRVGRRQFERKWCGTARVVGDDFDVTFMEQLLPTPVFKTALKRTYSAWGEDKQNLLARLHCGIVGVGSVGAIIAENLARMGVQTLSLIDFDRVEEHNLDRLLHATTADIKYLKVDVAAKALITHATADHFDVRALPLSVTSQDGLKAALDCDVLFSCVDRPWARQVLNMIAYAHQIPVVDGGIRISTTPSGKLRGADWRAHVAVKDRRCLECLGQFDPADVTLEREGLLDDPTYIEALPKDHFIHRNENVFAFATNAAGLMILQFLSLIIQPAGISNNGAQIFHFVTGTIETEDAQDCNPQCLFREHANSADHFPFTVTDSKEPQDKA